jgi:CBS-domain-containing membrane protein
MLRGSEEQARDFLRSRGRRVKDVMTSDVVAAAEDTPLADIAALLEKHRIKRVPVLRDGKIVGIVSRADLLQGFARSEPAWPTLHDDRRVRDELDAALREAGLPMHQVTVTVSRGAVRLRGWIDAEVQRQAARAAVEATPGVVSVEDDLVVTTPAVRAGRGYV